MTFFIFKKALEFYLSENNLMLTLTILLCDFSAYCTCVNLVPQTCNLPLQINLWATTHKKRY